MFICKIIKDSNPVGIGQVSVKSSPAPGETWLTIGPCESRTNKAKINQIIIENKNREKRSLSRIITKSTTFMIFIGENSIKISGKDLG